ncbi:hypothetical protein [Paenibacillus sp. y28]|uniref:hypothetical protein n=1 Tax=Paenibacillus sp. y28 TaxID=3129110 RepID=UPI003019E780
MAGQNGSNGKSKASKKTKQSSSILSRLSAQDVAVIAAILSDSLKVQSVLIDNDQTIQVVLQGSLKRKTATDKLVEQISDLSVGEVLKAILNTAK